MPPANKRRKADSSALGRLEERIESVSPLVRLLTPGGVVALIPIGLAMLGSLDDSREVACENAEITRAIVRVDNELSRPENDNLRRLLLERPDVCRED